MYLHVVHSTHTRTVHAHILYTYMYFTMYLCKIAYSNLLIGMDLIRLHLSRLIEFHEICEKNLSKTSIIKYALFHGLVKQPVNLVFLRCVMVRVKDAQ